MPQHNTILIKAAYMQQDWQQSTSMEILPAENKYCKAKKRINSMSQSCRAQFVFQCVFDSVKFKLFKFFVVCLFFFQFL